MLQGAGNTIRFSNIIAEFGRANAKGGVSLGAYRVSETFGAMSNLPLDTGIPQGGTIRMSNFYSKQLNCVVNYYDGSNIRRATARNRYNHGGSDRVKTIGGFRGRPGNTNGTRVIIHVNKRIGSEYDGSRGMKCALRTGGWNANTNLDVNIGSSGAIIGAAGAGGNGGSSNNGGQTNGKRGSSGLGVEYPIDLENYGFLAGGGGGGGGGKGERRDRNERGRRRSRCGIWCDRRSRNRRRDRRRKGGGGGGGGQGFPGGSGGGGASAGGSNGGNGSQGSPGNAGGGGGDGARSGGNGGSFGNNGGNGDMSGGHTGRSIVISGSGSVNYVVQGTIYGPVVNHPVF